MKICRHNQFILLYRIRSLTTNCIDLKKKKIRFFYFVHGRVQRFPSDGSNKQFHYNQLTTFNITCFLDFGQTSFLYILHGSKLQQPKVWKSYLQWDLANGELSQLVLSMLSSQETSCIVEGLTFGNSLKQRQAISKTCSNCLSLCLS